MNRFLDITILVVFLPVWIISLVIISALIFMRNGFPVFYRQIRIGQLSKPFVIFKFRTMIPERENGSNHQLADDSRTTALGRRLRRYHLDELPQLYNILRGEMSFVGPRPEIPPYYDASFKPIEHVLPGLMDSATLYWIDEERVLNEVEDRDIYYRTVILPDKLARSTEDIASKSVAHDMGLLLKAVRIVFLGGKKKTPGAHVQMRYRPQKVSSR